MTSQPEKQTITTYILLNILRSTGNQTDLVIYCSITSERFFFKNLAENESGRLVLDQLLFLKDVLYEVKACGLQHSVSIFR